MTVYIDELEIMVIVNNEKVLAPRRLEPLSIRLGQGHAGVQAAGVAVMLEARVPSVGHAVLCLKID